MEPPLQKTECRMQSPNAEVRSPVPGYMVLISRLRHKYQQATLR
jgi:hypothetical protein